MVQGGTGLYHTSDRIAHTIGLTMHGLPIFPALELKARDGPIKAALT